MATIRSRCQNIDFVIPNREIALDWLQQQSFSEQHEAEQLKLMLSLASGSPLFALNLLNNQQLEIRQFIIEQLLCVHNDDIDPVAAADELNKQIKTKAKGKSKAKGLAMTVYDVIYWIDSIIIDIVRLNYLSGQQQLINNIDYSQANFK